MTQRLKIHKLKSDTNVKKTACLVQNQPVFQVNKVLQVEFFSVLSEVNGVHVLQNTKPTVTVGAEGKTGKNSSWRRFERESAQTSTT